MREYEARIEGMTCPHCAMKVKKALESMGLKDVLVDLKGGYARFKSEEEVYEYEVKEAIQRTGYELKELIEIGP